MRVLAALAIIAFLSFTVTVFAGSGGKIQRKNRYDYRQREILLCEYLYINFD